MKTRRGRRWLAGAGGMLVALAMVAPGAAWAASAEAQQGRPARVRQVEPPALQARPAPDTRSWGSDRDEGRDRDWHDGHRDRDALHAWGRPHWGGPAWGGPYVPAPPPAAIYIPGQWIWNGWGWVWQPGYWTY